VGRDHETLHCLERIVLQYTPNGPTVRGKRVLAVIARSSARLGWRLIFHVGQGAGQCSSSSTLGPRSLAAYRGIAPDEILDDLEQAARALRDARILHVNAMPYGGGVSELLRSTVPRLNGLGLVADWKLIAAKSASIS
jgi:hypothetical protein